MRLIKRHFDIYKVNASCGESLPYVSEGMPAGFPPSATDYVGDRIDLNEVLIMNPGATYYAHLRDYYMVEEDLEQGDGILFDTSLATRTGDLALCEIGGEHHLKYIKKQGRKIWLIGGASDEAVWINTDTDAKVLGVVTVIIKVRRYKHRRIKSFDNKAEMEQFMSSGKREIKASYALDSDIPTSGLIDLNEELISNSVFMFFGKVSGESLLEDDISDNDLVIVDRSLEPQWRDIAVCLTQDGLTMRYVNVLENGQVWLLSGNDEYRPILVTEENEQLIRGVVTHSIRHLSFKKGGRK